MIDEKQVVYSKESLVDITTDSTTSTLGTVDISSGQITIGPKSSVSYEYTYEAGQESSIITDILQLDCSVIGLTTGMTTRYNRYLSILIKIQYYLEVIEGETKTYYDGNTDTFEIYPYLSNESNNTSYNIYLQNSYIKKINITYKNDYESNSVKYNDIKLKYSMSLLEAINKYGGGSTFIPGSNSLKFYSVNDKYSIDSYGDSLIMKIDIDENNWEEVVKPYIRPEKSTYGRNTMVYDENGINHIFSLNNTKMAYRAKIRWTVRSKSDNSRAFWNEVYGNEQIIYVKEDRDLSDEEKSSLSSVVGKAYDREYNRVLNSGDCWSEMEVYIENRYCKIIGYKTDTLVVRAEYMDAPNIYFEKEVKINNCSVVDFKLTFDNNEMKIRGKSIQFATLDIIPSNIRPDSKYKYAANLSCISYDETNGKVVIVDDNGDEYDNINYEKLPARVKIKGRNNGKVLFTAKTDGLYPSGFSKSWIVEVVDVPEYSDLYTKTPNGTVIDETKEYIDIIVGTNKSKYLDTDSRYGLESLDGVGQGYVKLLSSNNNKELTYRIYPLSVGKIKFWGSMQEDDLGNLYVGRVEIEVDITALYKELTTNLTTNTGLFEITQGGGQLEVYCTPNYNYAGSYSFSQVSVDGGYVEMNDYENKVRITADREGQTTLICKPERGPAVSHIITVSNQYPSNVKLTTPDNIDMIVSGGQLTVTGTPGNSYNNRHYSFKWVFDMVTPEVDYDIRYDNYFIRITGKRLGLLRVNCYREVDNKFVTSRVFKVVQSIGSIEVNLPYPDTKPNWVLFRRGDQNNSLFMGTLTGDVTKCIYSGTSIDYDATMQQLSQYCINDDGKTWKNYGNWSNDKNMTGGATELIASSVDVYDSNNNLIMNASEYETVNFANIIYGAYVHSSIELVTEKDTIYTNGEVKVKALNSDDTVAYDWQFIGTDVTVIEKTNRYVIFKSTSSGNLKVNYILSESGNIITGTDIKVIEKPTNLKYIRLYITKAYRNSSTVGYCNISELDILDSSGNSVLTDSCVYTADSVYSGSSDVPANAFDKNTSTIWHSADSSNAHWIQIEFASGIDLPSSYVVTRRSDSYNDYLASWELQVSTDGSTWITVDKHTDDTNWSSGYSRTFNL